ncbi:helix-turn-helix domain-containing protein [Kitasatospora sp. NPDC052896]|uniref:helix-turn-helix domain-containing protein n=1 Tax=Kitasatospora sp. NPDC052896 TaxID=3364061 RepID=UPI0037C6B2E1
MLGSFGELLRRHRRAVGMTQETLAETAALSARTVGNLERGRARVPQRRSVEALAAALGLAGPVRADFLRAATAERALRGGAGGVRNVSGGSPRPLVRPAQLPSDIADFTGRAAELERLDEILAGAGNGAGAEAMAMAVLTGPAGVGKTVTAVRAAHRARERFPDGQLHLDLRGRTETPPDPTALLGRLLRMLGVPAEEVPHGEPERVARYRGLVAGRRFLLLLDDAADPAQLAPLLPDTGSCGVLVTSRRRLTTGQYPGQHLELGPFERPDATALLGRLIGVDRVAAEPAAVDQVLAACAGLPLALRAAGARLAGRPTWGVAALAERLGDRERLLDELVAGDLSVRQGLRESYLALSGGGSEQPRRTGRVAWAGLAPVVQDRAAVLSAAEVFRLLGGLPGDRFCGWSLAARLALPRSGVAAALEELTAAHLVEPLGGGDYRIPPLVKCYATELAEFAQFAESAESVEFAELVELAELA